MKGTPVLGTPASGTPASGTPALGDRALLRPLLGNPLLPRGAPGLALGWRPWPVDAGPPAPVAGAVAAALCALGPLAFRLFHPPPLAGGLAILPASGPAGRLRDQARPLWRALDRPLADLALATAAADALEIFEQGWQAEDQAVLLLAGLPPARAALYALRTTRDWSGHRFGEDERALLLPGTDGAELLFAAADEGGIERLTAALEAALAAAGLPVERTGAPPFP